MPNKKIGELAFTRRIKNQDIEPSETAKRIPDPTKALWEKLKGEIRAAVEQN